jgi:hypothetical protein
MGRKNRRGKRLFVKSSSGHKGGAIRDGVILSLYDAPHASTASTVHALQRGCDYDEVIAFIRRRRRQR